MERLLHGAEVVEIQTLTHDVRSLSLRPLDPPRFLFVAGQYISIEVTEVKEGRARRNNRPYSIASPPEQPWIELCVNRVLKGPGSGYLHGLRVGDRMDFLPPMGDFTVKDDAETPLLFVATGTGIAPIRSMILHLIARGTTRPMTLYWGLRREEDLYYQEAFAALATQHATFRMVTTLSRASDAWRGARGRVTALLAERNHTQEGLEVYLCGSGAMIHDARALLIQQGLPKKSIHYERFFT